MLTLACTPEAIEALPHECFHHPHPHVQRKMERLYVKRSGTAGETHPAVMWIAKATYYHYLQGYHTGGLAQLQEVRVASRERALQAYRGPLEASWVAPPPATVAEA